MKHPHAELIHEWADGLLKNEDIEYKDTTDQWRSIIDSPIWDSRCQYRRRPKTININGFEVPEPMRGAPERGEVYYYVSIGTSMSQSYVWGGDTSDQLWLPLGLCHLTQEAAQTHIDALLSFTRKDKP